MFGSTTFASRPLASGPLGSALPTSFDVQPLPLPTELPQLFLANWLNGMIVNSAFETDLFLAEDQTEDRVARTTIPHREMTTTFTGMSRDESQELFLLALKGALERLPIPLPSDTSFLTIAALTTDTTINCDTTSRRIYKGARILIFDIDSNGIPIKQSFNRILSFTTTTITFTAAIGFAYPINALVIPLIDCHLNINQSGSFITDYNFNLPYVYREVEGPSSLPRMALSSNYSLHEGDPIFFPTHDWLSIPSISIRRPGTQFSSGNATIITTRGSKSEVDFTVSIKALTRVEAIDIISLFEDRLGRARIFWFVNLLNIWDVLAITTTTIDVDKSSSLALILSEITYIGVVTKKGAIQIRAITSIIDTSSTFRISIGSLAPAITLAEVAKVAPAYNVRFAEDGLTETWSTDQTCTMDLRLKELVNENSIPLGTTTPIPAFDSGFDEGFPI